VGIAFRHRQFALRRAIAAQGSEDKATFRERKAASGTQKADTTTGVGHLPVPDDERPILTIDDLASEPACVVARENNPYPIDRPHHIRRNLSA
jgi:hypothetical protein